LWNSPLTPGKKVIDVNLTGTFYMSQVFGQQLLAQGQGGSIINISSIGGRLMAPTTAAYTASKAGIHALTCAMSGEVGPHGIRVNAICPGIVMTSRLDDLSKNNGHR
jgi:NAD(P)-dependent dehydrogenase (short-subunit alcohol dehydrogenase family)